MDDDAQDYRNLIEPELYRFDCDISNNFVLGAALGPLAFCSNRTEVAFTWLSPSE